MFLQSKTQIKLMFFIFIHLLFQNYAYAIAVFDRAFGVNGAAVTYVGPEALASAVVIQPDGRIVVVGSVQRTFYDRDLVVVRYNPDGTLDTGFGNNGTVIVTILNQTATPLAVALQPDGKIVVAGIIEPKEGAVSSDFFVGRFNSNGSLDVSFGNGGAVALNQSEKDGFSSVAVQPDGKIIAAGYTSQNNYEGAVVRFNSNGTLDADFGSGGRVFISLPKLSNERLRSVKLLSNGRILAGGIAFNQPLADLLVQLNPDGTLATDFGNQGVVINNLPSAPFPPGFGMTVLPDGKILTVSSLIRRYADNGEIDSSLVVRFQPGGENIAVLPNGNFVVTRTRTFGSSGGVWFYHRSGTLIGGRASFNLATVNLAVQLDGKIAVIDGSASNLNSFTMKRMLTYTSAGTKLADYDGDEITDLVVRRSASLKILRSGGGIYDYGINENATRVIPEFYRAFGLLLPNCVYWQEPPLQETAAYFYGTTNGGIVRFQWGTAGDVPVGGDYDNDGRTDFTVFRPSNGVWYSTLSANNGFQAIAFGQRGDQPVPADYDYDGVTDVAVFRPSNGVWYVRRSSDGAFTAVQFGTDGDIPLTGDFDADGRADFVVYRPSQGIWYLLNTTQGFRAVQFGLPTDFPVPGEYDGDGRHDIAVFRQGIWYILRSQQGFNAIQWGEPNDFPVAVRYAFD